MVTKFFTEYYIYLVNSRHSHLVFILLDVNAASASESIINLKPEGVQFLKRAHHIVETVDMLRCSTRVSAMFQRVPSLANPLEALESMKLW